MKKQFITKTLSKVLLSTLIVSLPLLSSNVSAKADVYNEIIEVKDLNSGIVDSLPADNGINLESSETSAYTDSYVPFKLSKLFKDDENSARSIIGSDNRTQVKTTTGFPYSAICYLSIKFPDGATCSGTGWMYSKNAAITAGHCVYSKSHGGWAKSITVYPGKNGPKSPYGYATSTSLSAPKGWTSNADTNYDWGVIKLNKNIGNNTGYFGASYTSSSLTNTAVTICGYPGEKSKTQWKMNGKISSCTANKLSYTIDTTGGQSGSPVYKGSGKNTVSIGIHTNGSNKVNKATRITKSMFDYFNKFR